MIIRRLARDRLRGLLTKHENRLRFLPNDHFSKTIVETSSSLQKVLWNSTLKFLRYLSPKFGNADHSIHLLHVFFYSQVEHLIKPQLKLNSKALDLVDEVDNLVYRWRNDCPRIQIILFIGVFGFKSLNYGMERSEGSP